MKRVLYTKFSNERDPRFSIQTQVVEDENHKKYIKKCAACKEAEAHIKKLGEWEKKLEPLFSNSIFSINKRVQIGDEYFFEFVEGETLEEIVDRELKENGKEAAISILEKYISTIYSVSDGVLFHITDRFIEVFGEISFDNIERKSAAISNIDMVLSNVKAVSDSNWVVLDYEWTFDFPIPVSYIVYRVILYYLEGRNDRKKIFGNDLFDRIGISVDEQKVYRQMEDHFQRYVLGDRVPIRNMYRHLVKPAYDINYTLEQAKERRNYSVIQIYWNYGEGFSEENSWRYEPFADVHGIIHFKLDIPQGVVGVRIDPAFSACVVAVSNVEGIDERGRKCHLEYVTNGNSMGEGVFLFKDNDSQIVFNPLKENVKEINLQLEVTLLYEKVTDKLAQYVEHAKKCEDNYAELEKHYYTAMNLKADLEHRVADLDHRLYIAESNFHAIQGTFAWKVTKPLRKTLDILKILIGKNPKRKCFMKAIKVFVKKGFTDSKQYYHEELERWKMRYISDKVERMKQEYLVSNQNEADENILFSIIVPLYNTPEQFLHEMIESVLAQTYGNWELCLADGSDRKHKYVKRICKQYQKADKRVRYKKIRKNLGISGNTNVALDMAKGDYITLFDHDDFLHPYALCETREAIYRENADYVYTDEAVFSDSMFENVQYHFKPDFAPDTFRGVNYICHLSSFSILLLKEVGKFRSECDGSQDYDMMLRLTEKAKKIVHIPQVLYYWRSHAASVASGIGAKMYAIDGAHKALKDHLNRIGLKGEVTDAEALSSYRITYDIVGEPLVSIIIPNKDHVDDLKKCISSIKEKSTYSNYDIIIIENNSEEQSTFDYYKELEKDDRVNIVYYEGPFNYSAINNFGVQNAKGEYLILLNNDTEVITPRWIEEMLMYAQRQDVGVVGPMLYYEDDTIQHAGLIIGIGGSAGHSHKGFPRGDLGYLYRLGTVQNVSGVTGACLMVATDIYKKLNGLDEKFVVAFNDVDFCLRVREAGYLNVFTPFAELYHYESKSRGYEDTPEKMKRFENERNLLRERWKKIIIENGDPYYNPNLTLDREDFSIR